MPETPALPEFIRRRIERALQEAENPSHAGMHLGDGKVRVLGCDLHYMLRVIDAYEAARGVRDTFADKSGTFADTASRFTQADMHTFDPAGAVSAACGVASDGFRRCEFCGCTTNASVRACCERGKLADGSRAALSPAPSTQVATCPYETRDCVRTCIGRCRLAEPNVAAQS